MKQRVALILTIIAGLWNSIAHSQCLEKRVSLAVHNTSIKEVLKMLEDTSACNFSYSDDIIPVDRLISVKARKKPLSHVLKEVFAGTDISFAQMGNQVVFFKKSKFSPKQDQFFVSGFVTEKSSGEPLIGVNIFIPGTGSGVTTNGYGFYSLRLNTDSVTLIFSYVGYGTREVTVFADKDLTLDVNMTSLATLEEVIIRDTASQRISDKAEMSVLEIPMSQIKSIPALLGEKDVLKILQLLPGVQKNNEGQSGFYVRGGGPDQNLIIMDDATVYNAYHLFGFFSLFNSDAIKNAELTKGGFPARYGGRLSSVLDMSMKEGNKQEYHAEGGIGLISARLTVEGPIKKEKASFLLSARRTYIDGLLEPFLKDNLKLGYYFYDLNAKVNTEINEKNKLYLSGYFGRDRFYLAEKYADYSFGAGIEWGNATGTLRWNHLFNKRLFSNISIIYSEYNLKIYADQTYLDKSLNLSFSSGIRDVQTKADFDYTLSSKHKLRAGISAIWHHFTPSANVFEDDYSGVYTENKQTYEALETGIYLEDDIILSSRWKVNVGIRLSSFGETDRLVFRPEPRISTNYKLKKNLSLKASYAVMNQYVHLLSNTGVGLPTDLWVPSTADVPNQRSVQYAFGPAIDLPKSFAFSAEGYYKTSDNVIGYKDGANFIQVEDPTRNQKVQWEKNVSSGKGLSYGLELLLQRKTGNLTGWIGYTLSKTTLQFDDINEGKPYHARYDRRHDASFVGMYNITKNIKFSLTWVYGTGNAFTPPQSEYYTFAHDPAGQNQSFDFFQGIQVNGYGERNSERMPDYHRMDVGLSFFKKRKRFERTFEISVYNVYNRKNPFFYFMGYEYNNGQEKRVLKQITLFPIMPSMGLNFRF